MFERKKDRDFIPVGLFFIVVGSAFMVLGVCMMIKSEFFPGGFSDGLVATIGGALVIVTAYIHLELALIRRKLKK